MEKARLDCIRWLLKITKKERNHELILFVRNLWELGSSPFPYIVPVLPRPLPSEHFILADLLKLILGSSLQVDYAPEPFV